MGLASLMDSFNCLTACKEKYLKEKLHIYEYEAIAAQICLSTRVFCLVADLLISAASHFLVFIVFK